MICREKNTTIRNANVRVHFSCKRNLPRCFFFCVASCNLIEEQFSFNILRFLRLSPLVVFFHLLLIFFFSYFNIIIFYSIFYTIFFICHSLLLLKLFFIYLEVKAFDIDNPLLLLVIDK